GGCPSQEAARRLPVARLLGGEVPVHGQGGGRVGGDAEGRADRGGESRWIRARFAEGCLRLVEPQRRRSGVPQLEGQTGVGQQESRSPVEQWGGEPAEPCLQGGAFTEEEELIDVLLDHGGRLVDLPGRKGVCD